MSVEQVRETATISEKAAASAKSTGKMLVQFISPGWGSSGYYSPDLIEEAAAERVIPAGTHMYADHPTAEDRKNRPERSIRDLVAVTTTDAQLSPDGALVGEVKVMGPYQPLITDLKDHIGVSILGSAKDVFEGEAEGRKGKIFTGLAKIDSVDFVTRAGRGGQVLSLLESAGVENSGLVELSETTNDTRDQLCNLLKDAYGADKTYVYVRDFDDTTVWYQKETPDGSGIYAQPFEQDSDGTVKLTGTSTEVRAKTEYLAVGEGDAAPVIIQDAWLLDGIHVELAEALKEVATSPAGVKGTEKLHAYWRKHIKWGHDGDFDECVAKLSKYIKDPKGYCAKMHKDVTGAVPGKAAGESALTDELVLDMLESGLALDQHGHTYCFAEGRWQRVIPHEPVLTILESGLALDEEGRTYRLAESGWASVASVAAEADKVYHFKHGWIPLDHPAAGDGKKSAPSVKVGDRTPYGDVVKIEGDTVHLKDNVGLGTVGQPSGTREVPMHAVQKSVAMKAHRDEQGSGGSAEQTRLESALKKAQDGLQQAKQDLATQKREHPRWDTNGFETAISQHQATIKNARRQLAALKAKK